VRGCGEAFGSCLAVHPPLREPLGGVGACHQRALPGSLQLIDPGQASLELGVPDEVASGAAGLHDLLPRPRRPGEIAVELRAAPQALQRGQAAVLVLALRPQLDGAADRVGGVVVGVHLAEPLRRGQQARTGTVAFAAGEPLLGDRLGGRAAPLQLRRQPPVVAAPPGPRRVVVDGLQCLAGGPGEQGDRAEQEQGQGNTHGELAGGGWAAGGQAVAELVVVQRPAGMPPAPGGPVPAPAGIMRRPAAPASRVLGMPAHLASPLVGM
jgi:hypothetical protein